MFGNNPFHTQKSISRANKKIKQKQKKQKNPHPLDSWVGLEGQFFWVYGHVCFLGGGSWTFFISTRIPWPKEIQEPLPVAGVTCTSLSRPHRSYRLPGWSLDAPPAPHTLLDWSSRTSPSCRDLSPQATQTLSPFMHSLLCHKHSTNDLILLISLLNFPVWLISGIT